MYRDFFRRVSFDGPLDMGYTVINYIGNFAFNGNYTMFLFAVHGFVFLSFYNFIKANGLDRRHFVIALVFIIGMYAVNTSIIRQYIAIAILLYSFRYAIDKKLIKFIAVVALATLFHRTAFVFAAVYFIPNKTPAYWKVFAVFAAAMLFQQVNGLHLLINFSLQYVSFIFEEGGILGNTEYLPKLNVYLSVAHTSYASFAINILKRMIYMAIFMYARKHSRNTLKNHDFYLNTYFLGTFVVLISVGSIPAFTRLANYFFIVDLLLLPVAFRGIPNKYLRICAVFVIIAFTFANFMYTIFVSGEGFFYPYNTIFGEFY
jgi:hypothetical protein